VPLSRLVVVHADLQRMEWPGTRELAERQARHYGLRFEVVRRNGGDLLDYVRKRGKWPSAKARYCTSDFKRGPVRTLFTRLAAESRRAGLTRRVRILNCMGLRAEESPARAKLLPFRLDRGASNGRRTVHTWLPIHGLTTAQVWQRIREGGLETHPAYRLGMPRLSCVLCVFSPKNALMLAGKHNPELLKEYVAVEQAIGHRFRMELSLVEVQQCLDAGEQPGPVSSWAM
jgi:3'-phosphoadenosine 5'-phosphosulfate sulfotransferase (PAPS reductase)/FAD synthetase